MIKYLKESAKTEIKFQIRVFLPLFIILFSFWFLVFSNNISIKDILLLSLMNTLNIYIFISIFIKPPNLGIDCYPERFRGFLRIGIFLLSCYLFYILMIDIFNL